MWYVTDSTRSHARKTSIATVASQMIAPQCRSVTNDSGVTTMHSENERATENGNASHDDHVNITSNGVPTVSDHEHTSDHNVATTPTESDKGNNDVTTTNEDVKTDIP